MKFSAHDPISDATAAMAPGLSPQHRDALGQAGALISQGHDAQVAVDHLVSTGMPRVVAKVLVKQIDKRG